MANRFSAERYRAFGVCITLVVIGLSDNTLKALMNYEKFVDDFSDLTSGKLIFRESEAAWGSNMDGGTSSSSSEAEERESSPDEGEYLVSPEVAIDFKVPKFNFCDWDPNPENGTSYLGLLPIQESYDQSDHIGKIKVSTSHRRIRMREFINGKRTGRDIIDDRKLRHASDQNDYYTVLHLLETGVDPNGCDDKKRTALHFAAAKGHDNIVNVLLDHGANPNQKDVIGNTALHLAVCAHHVKVVTILLKGGTNLMSTDNMGKTPLHLAHSRLKTLHGDKNFTSEQLKGEVTQVVGMMKEYLNITGHTDSDCELSQLTEKLTLSTTIDEVHGVNELLAQFTSLKLESQKQSVQTIAVS